MFKFWHRTSSPAGFWKWFMENEVHFRDFTKVETRKLAKIGVRLRRVCPDFVFEIEPRVLTISADGVSKLFPKVREFVAAAPAIPGWTIQAFRQPTSEDIHLSVGDQSISRGDVKFMYKREGHFFSIVLLLPGYDPSRKKDWLRAAFLLLDATVGEEMVATRLADISLADRSVAPGRGQPLSLLPRLLDLPQNGEPE